MLSLTSWHSLPAHWRQGRTYCRSPAGTPCQSIGRVARAADSRLALLTSHRQSRRCYRAPAGTPCRSTGTAESQVLSLTGWHSLPVHRQSCTCCRPPACSCCRSAGRLMCALLTTSRLLSSFRRQRRGRAANHRPTPLDSPLAESQVSPAAPRLPDSQAAVPPRAIALLT